MSRPNGPNGWVLVHSTVPALDQVTADLAKTPAAKGVDTLQMVEANSITTSSNGTNPNYYEITIAPCSTITSLTHVAQLRGRRRVPAQVRRRAGAGQTR